MAWYDKLNEAGGVIAEELKRTFYSDKEAKQELVRNKSLSTTTPAILSQEPDLILTDTSQQYTLGSTVDYILTMRNALIKQWRNATFVPEVDEAIQEIVNEALVFEENGDLPIELDLEDIDVPDKLKKQIIESFAKIMIVLDFSKRGHEIFRQWYIDGILNLECVYDNNDRKAGIKKIILLNPFDFFKVKDMSTGKIEYFYSNRLNSELYNKPTFNLLQLQMDSKEELRYKDEQITQITSGVNSVDKLFSISHLNKAMKVVNQVSLIEDSIIIYRITRAPEKKAFYIDTGRLPKGKAEQYLTTMMNKHRNKLVYNVETGTIENRKKSIALFEDFWLTRNSEGRGTEIETIQGTGSELRDIADLDYFYDKMYRALSVPTTRRQKSESRFTGIGSQNVDIEREEIKFFKFILNVRKRFNELFKDLLKKELITSLVISVDDWNKIREKIKFKYINNNEYSEMKKLLVFESRMNIAQLTTDLVENKMVSKAWVRKEVLNQTEEEMKEMDKEIEEEQEKDPDDEEDGFGGGGGFGGQQQPQQPPVSNAQPKPFGAQDKPDNAGGRRADDSEDQ